MDNREINHKWYESFDESTMQFIIKRENDEGEEQETKVPAIFEVCGLCNGRGKCVNPSIDRHGLSREDFDNDPDFAESYFRGDYDVLCPQCDGKRVAPTPNYEDMKPELREFVEDYISEHFADQREQWTAREYGY